MRYIDYGTMQSDAQRRVLDMQRRARNAVYMPTAYIPPNESSTLNQSDEAAQCSTSEDCTKPETITEAAGTPIKASAQQVDPERLLLLAVLILLLSEKADTVLILAIIYLLL